MPYSQEEFQDILRKRQETFANEKTEKEKCIQEWNTLLVTFKELQNKETVTQTEHQTLVQTKQKMTELRQKYMSLVTHQKQLRFIHRLSQLLLAYFHGLLHMNDIQKEKQYPLVKNIETWTETTMEKSEKELEQLNESTLHLLRSTLLTLLFQYASCPVRFSFSSAKPLTLQDMYIWWFEPELNVPEFRHKDICDKCKQPLLLEKHTSQLVCKCDGRMHVYFNMTNPALEYNKNHLSQNHNDNGYQRFRFIKNWLSQFKEGSPKTDINVVLKVKRELLNQGNISKSEVRQTSVRSILKRLGLTQHNPNAQKIAHTINGQAIAQFSEAKFNEILERVEKVEEAYTILKGGEMKRVNYPNLQFLINKICKINGWHDEQRSFRVQRVEHSLTQQEEDWRLFIPVLRKIDDKHNWMFNPSR